MEGVGIKPLFSFFFSEKICLAPQAQLSRERNPGRSFTQIALSNKYRAYTNTQRMVKLCGGGVPQQEAA